VRTAALNTWAARNEGANIHLGFCSVHGINVPGFQRAVNRRITSGMFALRSSISLRRCQTSNRPSRLRAVCDLHFARQCVT
jgi:hypothetical protein